MNAQKFAETRGEFDVFDMKAKFAFRSESSVSFHLGRWGSIVQFRPDGPKYDDRRSFTVCGWIDVHHPCYGNAAARIRFRIPKEFAVHSKVMSALDAIFSALEIPSDSTFVASVIHSDDGFEISYETNVFHS